MNSSAEPNVSMSGRATCTNSVSIAAPTMPPISDAVNAADSARAACPCCERGKPPSTVAWLALEPGIPMSTDVNVSGCRDHRDQAHQHGQRRYGIQPVQGRAS